jgi:hypothetical protein
MACEIGKMGRVAKRESVEIGYAYTGEASASSGRIGSRGTQIPLSIPRTCWPMEYVGTIMSTQAIILIPNEISVSCSDELEVLG